MRMSDEQLAAFDQLQLIIDARKNVSERLRSLRARAQENGDDDLAEAIAQTNRDLGKLFIRILHTETKILTSERLTRGTELLRALSQEVCAGSDETEDVEVLLSEAAAVAQVLTRLPEITWN